MIEVLFTLSCNNQSGKTMKKNIVFTPPISHEEASLWADSMVSKMTLEEKASLIGGREIFYTEEIPRLNIPKVLFADATQGVHIRDKFGKYVFEPALEKSTAMPCPILLASTWNKKLSGEYAKAIGEECKAGAIPVLLGPGMNIYRLSQCGRNFEYFGEDPFLAARMIENYVVALQNTGTIATLKHFVANNTDFYRRRSNSILDERTLHEIYLPAFKAGIDAGAMAVMTAYNLVDGEWAGQSKEVINDLLKEKLGFKWLVMTDWWSVNDGQKVIQSGQDLEMPSSDATKNAVELVKDGKVKEKEIDRMVHSILKTLHAIKGYGRKKDNELLKNFPDHEQTALAVAREGVILLRNKNNILPINRNKVDNIVLTGDYADKVAHGGGAAQVEGYNNIPLNIALEKEFGDNLNCLPEATDKEIKDASVVLLSIGTFDSEGWDRSFDLPKETLKIIDRVSSLNKNTVVIVNTGSGVNMSPWRDKVAAILYAWYPGQIGNLATAEILSGKVNPSGKLPVTIEKDFKDSPAADYLPEGEKLYYDWPGEAENSFPVWDLKYNEGIFVGYRWYEAKKIEPLYPFGFGLSYTDFEYSNLKINKESFTENDEIRISFDITNTGKYDGMETAQLYVSDIECTLKRPLKELKGFEKVELEIGETKTVEIILTKEDFSFYDSEKKNWVTEPGQFKILIASSSADIHLSGIIHMK